jgi:hypothetical protein
MNTRFKLTIFVAFLCISRFNVYGASAVAVGLDPETGRLTHSYWAGNKSEAEARKRAIAICKITGGTSNPRIIASTSRNGFGVVVAFKKEGKTVFTASIGASTSDKALSDAMREARLEGAQSAAVVTVWNDIPARQSHQ